LTLQEGADLDGTGEQMTVMGLSSSERWSIVETELRLAFRQLLRGLEGINLSPELEDLLFGSGEVDGSGSYQSALIGPPSP
jgi:hypothetical protein